MINLAEVFYAKILVISCRFAERADYFYEP